MMRRTCGSWIPRARSCSSTIRRRATARSLRLRFIERKSERFEIHDGLVVGELETERCDRNVALLDGGEIARLVVLPRRLFASDPVVELSPGIGLLHDDVSIDAHSQSRDPDPFDVAPRNRRDVDVEAGALVEPAAKEPLHEVMRH